MNLRIALAMVLVLCVSGFGLAGTLIGFRVVDAVNAKLPETERFAATGWYWSKSRRLREAYQRLYPNGQLLRRQGVFGAISLGCGISVAVLLGAGFWSAWVGAIGAAALWMSYFRKSSHS